MRSANWLTEGEETTGDGFIESFCRVGATGDGSPNGGAGGRGPG